MNRYVIYGTGNIGTMIARMLRKINVDFALTDSNPNLWEKIVEGERVIPSVELLKHLNNCTLVICVNEIQEKAFICYMSRYTRTIGWKELIDDLVNCYEEKGILYNTNYNENFKKWWFGLRSEIEFWEDSYAVPNARKHDRYQQLIDNVNFEDEFLNTDFLHTGAKVVDVGSGIVSRYGNKWKNGTVELIAVDPLAFWYNEFNHKYNEHFLKKDIKFGLFEELAYTFENKSIDLIIISNALDHCIDPYLCILQSMKILKIGGKLYIKSLRRESCNEKCLGLHQWNIDINKKDDFVIWNADAFVNVTKAMRGICDFTISKYDADERGLSGNWGFITIEMEKKKEMFDIEEKNNELTSICREVFGRIVNNGQYKDDSVWKYEYEKNIKKIL